MAYNRKEQNHSFLAQPVAGYKSIVQAYTILYWKYNVAHKKLLQTFIHS